MRRDLLAILLENEGHRAGAEALRGGADPVEICLGVLVGGSGSKDARTMFTRVAARLEPVTEPCGFCHGEPVGNAAAWIDGSAPAHAPCPRCGEVSNAPE